MVKPLKSDNPDSMQAWLRPIPIRWLALLLVSATILAIFSWRVTTTLRDAEIDALREDAGQRAVLEIGTLTAEIEKFRALSFVLTELPDVDGALGQGSAAAAARLDGDLQSVAQQTGATVLFAVDRRGIARAASNAGRDESFVGFDFRFRPYFVQATRTGAGEYYAQGSVTGRPGLFLARRAGPADNPLGAIVIKIEFDRIERVWRSDSSLSMVVDDDGVILIASDPALRLQTIAPIDEGRRRQLIASRQFGGAALRDAGIRMSDDGFATDAAGRRFIAIETDLALPGWRHVHLEPVQPAIASARSQSRFATLLAALVIAGLLGAAGWSATRNRRRLAARLLLEEEVGRRTVELTDAYERLQAEGAERQRADARYRAAREELAQSNRLGSIGTITTSVAHEINQPVAAIRTAAENATKLLARGRTEPASQNLDLIVSLTARIGSITSELLSFARRGLSEAAPTALDDILDGALLLVGSQFARHRVKLEVVREPGLPRLRVVGIQIEQVLVNLLQNALDEVGDRVDGIVRLTAGVSADAVSLIVEDNGAGVPDDLADTVFQPFHTGKKNGTGLGLGISRDIVRKYGGDLRLDRSQLGGARFSVTLPREGGTAP